MFAQSDETERDKLEYLPKAVVLNLYELATHFFGLKILRHTYVCLIKTKILVLLVIIDEISIVFMLSSLFQDLAEQP
jgi:hypothetical protein